MRKRAVLIFLICIVATLLFAAPALAEEVFVGTVGETQASVDTEAGTTEANASGAASYSADMSELTEPEPIESIAPVSAETDTDPESDSDTNDAQNVQIEVGEGSTISVEAANTTASGFYIQGAGEANASESVENVVISAPDESSYEKVLEAEYSDGDSRAKVGYLEDVIPLNMFSYQTDVGQDTNIEVIPPLSYAASTHHMGRAPEEDVLEDGQTAVSLFDGAIVFDDAFATAGASIIIDGTPSAYAYSYVSNLRVWDPDAVDYTTAGYPEPLNVNSTWTGAEINNLLEALNTILAKSNLEVLAIVDTLTQTIGPSDPDGPRAQSEAIAMEVAEYDDNGILVTVLTICDDFAEATLTSAHADDVEAVISFIKPEVPEEPEKPVTPTVEEVIEITEAQPVEVVVETEEAKPQTEAVLPYTGSDFSGIVFLAFGLIGTGVTLRRKFS